MIVDEHVGEAEIPEVGHILDKAVSCALMGICLARVAEFRTFAKFGHGFEEETAEAQPQSWCHAAPWTWTVSWMGGV